MVAAGPRVGGAHVSVNLNFDDSSLDALASRIHRQLAKIGDQNRKLYQGIGRSAVTAWRSALGAILAGAPLIGGAISAASGAITSLASALYSLGQASAASLPIFTSLGIAAFTLSSGLNNFFAAVAETSDKGLKELLATMPEQMQKAVLSVRALNNEMRAALFPVLFRGLSDGIDKLRDTGVIQKGLVSMAGSINGLVRSILDYANTKGGVSTLNKFFQNNADVFAALSKAVVPFLDAFLGLINALTPSSLRLSKRILQLAEHFQDLTNADGFGKRIDDAMKVAFRTTRRLFQVVGNLGKILSNVFGAADPGAKGLLFALKRITGRFKHFTSSVEGQEAIKEWVLKSVVAMKVFGETIRAVFDVIKKLTSSEILISFLQTVEGAFKLLQKLPTDKLTEIYLKVADALRPISSAMLAAVASIVTFNIFVGSIAGQIGGFFSTLSKFSGVDPFKGVAARTGKHAAEIGKFTGALKGIGSIAGKAIRFAGIAGLAIQIGIIISKSDKLKAKMKDAFQAFKDLAEPLKTAFNEIKTALGPVTEELKPFSGVFKKIAELGIGLILDSIIYAFKSFGNVITGVGRIVAGAITFFDGLFHLDGSKMLEGLKKIGSGVVPLLKGLFGLFVTFFAPAKFLKLGAFAFKALGRAIKGAFPAIRASSGVILKGVLRFLGQLPGKLIVLGRRAITKLSDGFRNSAPGVLQAVVRMIGSVLKFIGTLPAKLLSLGFRAVKSLAGSLKSGAGKVLSAAGTIFKAFWNEVKGLPGDLLKLGGAMIGGIVDGILGKLGDIKDAAGKIGSAIKDFLPGSPVREGPLMAWNAGGGATGGGRNIIDAITGGLKDTDPIRKAMAGVADAVSSSMLPRVATAGGEPRTAQTRVEHGSSGGNVYIAKMMPHNYGEFEKQTREKKRLASLGGRPA